MRWYVQLLPARRGLAMRGRGNDVGCAAIIVFLYVLVSARRGLGIGGGGCVLVFVHSPPLPLNSFPTIGANVYTPVQPKRLCLITS